ncbi:MULTISPECIES: hypothetical protein [unclassified Leptolyngbya]|uniref:hypothetical protein n=1 Tax=unclassified Leptolyngbya TaxID=2650499 RepID=UPI0016839313|nr:MULTISPECIES: hypothetical protein [unclassified Leptolyngbya]MBD1912921.1 hypothetical protein [Leptolyngbya sp. FACHB-8]MBD2154750.1 hypothetical protein [Leptolyngbya sp. FACHB-16]
MERGLLWLPLLVLFFWLAWAGWNEYQKLEAYKVWASDFERAKYDILSALGQSGDTLTWGKPTRQGPINLQTLSRQQISSVQVWVDGGAIALDAESPTGRRSEIRLQLPETFISIPFTDATLAVRWGRFLNEWLQSDQTV